MTDNKKTLNSFIKDMDSLPIDNEAKLLLLIAGFGSARLISELKSKALQINSGMEDLTGIYAFAYGVLKITRPELF